jgi:uncharacterized protein (TIGR02271 family)
MPDATQHDGSFWDKVKNAFSGQPNDFDQDEDYYRTRHSAGASAADYDRARPAYRLGHVAGLHDDAGNRQFEDVEPDLRRGYESEAGNAASWDDVRPHAADAYARGRERRIVLSEEQLSVGKRQVQAGEVGIRKTVETEHVRETVPLMREEVTIERHPVSADAAARGGELTIGEDEIRVPLMREEAVVAKTVVPTEEVVVRTNTVTEQQNVEADLRHERLTTEGLNDGRSTGAGLGSAGLGAAGTSGAADRATDSGVLDRTADRLDDLKDRVDGNPASRPGPDATDRRI